MELDSAQHLSSARNIGVRANNAEALLILDAGDTVAPTAGASAINVFDADPLCGIVASWVEYSSGPKPTWRPKGPIELTDAVLAMPIPAVFWFRRDVWEQTDGFDERFAVLEDWDFCIAVLRAGWSIRVVHRPLARLQARPVPWSVAAPTELSAIHAAVVQKHATVFGQHVDIVLPDVYAQLIRARVALVKAQHTPSLFRRLRRRLGTYRFLDRLLTRGGSLLRARRRS